MRLLISSKRQKKKQDHLKTIQSELNFGFEVSCNAKEHQILKETCCEFVFDVFLGYVSANLSQLPITIWVVESIFTFLSSGLNPGRFESSYVCIARYILGGENAS